MNRTTLNETTPARPGAWRPGPFLLIQLALHGAALLQLMIYPQEWRLTHQLAAGDILLLHDGNAARTPAGEALIVTVLPQLLDSIRVQGLTPVTLAHACNLP